MKYISIISDIHYSEKSPSCRVDNYAESLRTKLKYVFDHSDAVICAGDLFHSKDYQTKSLYGLTELLKTYRQMGKEFYVLAGNHDLYYENLNDIDRTALGFLNLTKVLTLIPEYIEIFGVPFRSIPYKSPITVPENAPKRAPFLLGHCFYENNLDPEFSLTREMLQDKDYSYVILGHDHRPYDPVTVESNCPNTKSTVVYRYGSFSRNLNLEYNRSRIPTFFKIGVESESVKSIEIHNIETAPLPLQIFSQSSVMQEPSGLVDFSSILNMDEIFKGYAYAKVSDHSLSKTLEELGTPDNVITYLKHLHKCNNLHFS